MGAATAGDLFTGYIKPSLGDELVLRKPNSRQSSARLKDRQAKLKKLKDSPNAPAAVAHAQCKAAGKTVTKKIYKPGKGYEDIDVCPIQDMRGYLREALKKI
jgi:hypothetical protein